MVKMPLPDRWDLRKAYDRTLSFGSANGGLWREADVPQRRQKLLFGALPFCRFDGARRGGDRMKLDIPLMDTKGPLQLNLLRYWRYQLSSRCFESGPQQYLRPPGAVASTPPAS